MIGLNKILIVSCFLLFSIVVLYGSFWTEWYEDSSNPVLDPVDVSIHGYYPFVVYDHNQFSGHGASTYYKMWFDRDEGGGIALAYSNNGINWTEYNGSAALPGLQPTADHPVVVYDPGGFGGSGVYYKLWYWHIPGNYASIQRIRYAESVNGINWVNDQPVSQHPTDTNLQLIHGSWGTYFYHNYGPGYVIYNSSAANTGWGTPNDKSDDDPWSFRYIMFYLVAGEGGTPNGSSEQEGMAYSVDGLYWIRYGNTPVLMGSGNTADWDYTHLYGTSVLNIGGSWHMWYIGANGIGGSGVLPYAHGIGHATSPDGLSWTRDADNPAMHYTDGISWRSGGIQAQCVVYDPNNFSGHGDPYPVKMWYSGHDLSGNDTIGYAWLPAFTNHPPVACFVKDREEGFPPLTINLDASCSHDPDGTITSYRWRFSDGAIASGLTASKVFDNPGEYTIKITVTDNGGAKNSTTQYIKVNSPVYACCSCGLGDVISGFADLTLTFNASCSRHLTNGSIVKYIWDFGNGDTAEGEKAVYTYTEAGVYIVSVTAYDAEGYKGTSKCVTSIEIKAVYPPDGELIQLQRLIDRSLFRGAAFHKISWGPNSKNNALTISQYRIYRKLASEPDESYQQIGYVNGSIFEYTDSNLPLENKYSYVITSVESGGHESKYSAPVENEVE